MDFGHLYRETFKGRTLGRAIQNWALRDFHLEGEGLDLGASTNHGSYYEFLRVAPTAKIEFGDLHPKSDGVLEIDLEKPLPVADDSKDFIVLNNVLGNVFNHGQCIRECRRVLKPNGQVVGVVAFFHILIPDPEDYFRFSEAALQRLFMEAGFQSVEIRPLGYGAFSACANTCAALLKFDLLRFLAYVVGIGIDKAIAAIVRILRPGSDRGRIWTTRFTPIYYLFHATK